MAINFETVTGNQTSANVLTQINNNFAKISSGSVPNADSATNADTVDNKQASELIPGAAIFLNSITSLNDLGVGRYFCTQTGQSWEPVTTTGSRTFLIEVSLDIPNNLKSYKINYIAGEGAGESYYSDYSSGSIRWNRIVTNGNIENLLSIYNYLILNNIKMQPVLAQDGFYMIENKKSASLITDDGTKYFIISYSGTTVTIKMYNFDTDELLATQTATQDSTITSIYYCYSDNSVIMFYTYDSGTKIYIGYVATFSEDSITIALKRSINSSVDNIFNSIPSLSYNVHDGRYNNDNYIIGVGRRSNVYCYYNKLTQNTGVTALSAFAYNNYNMYPGGDVVFLSKNANIFCGIGDEHDKPSSSGSGGFRPGGFIYNLDTSSIIRLQLGSINISLNTVYNNGMSGTRYGGVVIVGNFVYVSADFKYNGNNAAASGIFKFDITNGNYIGRIPYEQAGFLKLAYQDEKTILCVEDNNIFEIDVDSFTIKNNYNGQPYILNPAKTKGTDLVPPCVLNDKYHKIAVNKSPFGGGVSKIDYYVGYNDYWLAIGGV